MTLLTLTKSALTETNESMWRRTPPDSSNNPPRIDSEVTQLDPTFEEEIVCVQDDTVIVDPGVVLQRQKQGKIKAENDDITNIAVCLSRDLLEATMGL